MPRKPTAREWMQRHRKKRPGLQCWLCAHPRDWREAEKMIAAGYSEYEVTRFLRDARGFPHTRQSMRNHREYHLVGAA
jgi:hypothetical protein